MWLRGIPWRMEHYEDWLRARRRRVLERAEAIRRGIGRRERLLRGERTSGKEREEDR